jgi:inosine-uridine nucleoside N-ribohydrolase
MRKLTFLLVGLAAVLATSSKQPVIIDTDIGTFLDDSFAIAYAVLSQDLDVKLVVTCTDDTTARAKVAAKLLRMLGRDDIPIGIGIKNENKTTHTLFDWGKNEDLSKYRGGVEEYGVWKMSDILMHSAEIVDIIAIGPMTNFPTLVEKYPESVKKARIRAMAGSINTDYSGKTGAAVAEYNVAICPWCMEVLLEAGWNVTITPLDTCGTFSLTSREIRQVLESSGRASAAFASTLLYFCIVNTVKEDDCYLTVETPYLYDVVATLLAMPTVAKEYLNYSDMRLRVNGTGFTVVDDVNGVSTSIALEWKGAGTPTGKFQFAEMIAILFTL